MDDTNLRSTSAITINVEESNHGWGIIDRSLGQRTEELGGNLLLSTTRIREHRN